MSLMRQLQTSLRAELLPRAHERMYETPKQSGENKWFLLPTVIS